MNKTPCTLLLMLAASALSADPAPFGLELGVITQGQAGIRYPMHPVGINPLTLGEQFELDGRQFPVAGLKTVRLIFGSDRRLLAVLADGARDRYDALQAHLAGKYRQVESAGPEPGKRYARFIDGDCEIVLSTPPGAGDLQLSYVHRRLREALRARQSQQAQDRRCWEAAQL